jgi:hypothetical protein
MTKPIITIHNAETNEVETREMNATEFAQWEADAAVAKEIAAKQHEAEVAKATAEAKLAALGLTTDDLKALGLGGN